MEKYFSFNLPIEQDIINPLTCLRNISEQSVKKDGIWRIHKSDPDNIFPSDPHADRVDAKEKLDLYTGEVFDKVTHDFLYKMSKKSMQFIYHTIIRGGEANIIAKLNQNKHLIQYPI